jgi:hypothetical protein
MPTLLAVLTNSLFVGQWVKILDKKIRIHELFRMSDSSDTGQVAHAMPESPTELHTESRQMAFNKCL